MNININDILNLDAEEYKSKVSKMLSDNVENKYFYKVNKILLKACSYDAEKVLVFCEINNAIYLDCDKRELYACNLYTLLNAIIYLKDPQELMKRFSEAIKYVIANDFYNQGVNILKIIRKAYEHSLVSEDEYFQFAKYAVNFYVHFKRYSCAIDLMCDCAFSFSSVRAYQSAYRLLHDAQSIVQENELWEKQADILFTQGSICIEEGDYNTAETDLGNAMTFLSTMNEKTQALLISNLATVKMRTGKYDNALELFSQLLSEYVKYIGVQLEKSIHVNIAVCQRELGRLEQARSTIDNVIISLNTLYDIEAKIEAYLVAARIYILTRNNHKAVEYICNAISLIEERISSTVRLHYRRGYREKYITRINGMIFDVVEGMRFENIIDMLVFSKMNTFSDWLSVLEWYKTVIDDKKLSRSLREDITRTTNKLIQFGTPVLYGFREKYDDPFEEIEHSELKYFEELDYSKAWLNFNLSMERITNTTEHKLPFKYSSIRYNSDLILDRVENKSCYVFVYTESNFIDFVYNCKGVTKVKKIDSNNYFEYLRVLMNYQTKFVSFAEFASKLQTTVNIVTQEFEKMISEIIDDLPSELVILPDKISYKFPIIPVLIQDYRVRELLQKCKIRIKYCPIIYKSNENSSVINNYIGILTPAEDLPLLNDELRIPKKMLTLNTWEKYNLGESELDFNQQEVRDADIIHISSHGFPISRYSDPVFASIAGGLSEYSLTLETIQSEFWKLNHGIVITNACDSADISFKNYQKYFLTNELISYSCLFMLNGKSSSIAVSWPIKDIMSFVFSYLYYQLLSQGNTYELAYGLALVNIYELKKEELLNIISTIEDEDLRNEKLKMFANSNSMYPLRNPYCYGAFLFSSLL